MKRKVIGSILLGMVILSACSFSGAKETDQEADTQSETEEGEESEESGETDDSYETDKLKEQEKELLSEFMELTEDTFPEKIQRAVRWEEKECADNLIGTVQVPVLDENGMQDMSWFCDDICDWIELCLEQIPYDEAPWLYQEVIVDFWDDSASFYPSEFISGGYDRAKLYGGLYDFLDENINAPEYPVKNQTEYGKLTFEDDGSGEGYESYEARCTYKTRDGIIYGMVEVDRAAGSSYYSLVAQDGPNGPVALINPDPYNGMGGEAKWIQFMEDSNLGFACLTYNGGDDAFLFRTTDGGRSFEQIDYPSARIKLPDGSVYNPFTIPERVWAEDGDIYMLVEQSPWSGDYYSEELDKHPAGLYVSHDDGTSFEYIGEQ